ncbi:PLP-dependent aminotransferase family protein [Pedobacter sp. L105]|uniref:MocR-like pyridoxine biosynthesis transcription factor PdxR n=1 Tax=Pedobacter sp. L105 TaxID=1641871 RepID=UPI00131E359C|nr:PLP-dependent aminotransferase family protein [Pedobacter sp. L105]
MQLLASLLSIDKSDSEPVYLQMAGKLMELIKNGTLQAGHQLPSTRKLAEHLSLHRKTVIRAYDELLAQGWLESHSGSGTFVAKHLPEIKAQNLLKNPSNVSKTAGFTIETAPHLNLEVIKLNDGFHLDDGFPDARLAPLAELTRAYRSQLLTGNSYVKLGYHDPQGSSWLREELAAYLSETRGLKITSENILITRGTVMGLYLTCTGLLKTGDHVVTGETSWRGADTNFVQAGAIISRIPVDEYGIQVDELEKICLKQAIRLVYVTSHHHYPTTVALRADRRIHLLRLAEKYGFIIFEDDYDYDFHYQNKPLLPLASADPAGMVLYCGSFTKTISPAFRVGYLVASANVIQNLTRLRRIIDRQGDIMLENAIAELLQNGVIQRHLRKSLRVYRQRRDVCCNLLKDQLGNSVDFEIPDGGMAVWTRFDPKINLPDLAQRALKKDLYFSNGLLHQKSDKLLNATRLGFASSSTNELEKAIEILAKLIKTIPSS